MEDEIEVIDNEIDELDGKISDLREIKEPNDEHRKQLATLQGEKKSRLTKRTQVLLGRTKAAEDRARKAEERAERLEEEFKSTRTSIEKRLPAERVSRAKVTYDGEDFFTDASLRDMVQSGEMTEDEAWDHQETRRVAAAADRISKKSEQKLVEETRRKVVAEVLDEYPQLNPSYSKYSLKDPLTAEVDRLLRNGYQFRPDGLKLAVEDAKRNLRLTDKRPDLSEEFSVETGSIGDGTRKKETKVVLSDWEQDNAVRMYVNTGSINPKTSKPYTKTEAIEKALQAKQRRAEELATR